MPVMVRRVFLHVGAPKSGTSYLQDRLARSTATLAAQDVHYPSTQGGTHFEAALDVIQRDWGGELGRVSKHWDALAAKARKVEGTVVISQEILAAATREQARRVLDSFPGDEVHVVVTARDLARQLPAEWQESVKHRRSLSFRQYARRVRRSSQTDSDFWFWRVQGLPDVLTRWGSTLDPGRVHLVTVPPSGTPRDELWNRFAHVLGLDPFAAYADSQAVNQSVGTAEIAVLRRLNKRLRELGVGRPVYVEVVREWLTREVLAGRDGQVKPELPPRMWPFVERVSDQWCEWVRESGFDVVGDLDDLIPHPPEVPPPHPDRPPAEDALAAAVDALAAAVVRLGEPVERHERRVLVQLKRRLQRP